MRWTNLLPISVRVAVRPPLQCMGILKPLNVFDAAVMRSFKGKPCCVVQIGANDGKLADPLYSWLMYARPWTRHWTGLLVEPIPYVFERLKENYGGRSGVQYLNAAIAERSGSLKLWTIRPEAGRELSLSPHFELLASADRDLLVKQLGPRIEPYIQELSVPCFTLAEAIAKARIGSPDLLIVDAEGYDWAILHQLDFEAVAPKIVLYEHSHMSSCTRAECREMFESNGYVVSEDSIDTVAVRP